MTRFECPPQATHGRRRAHLHPGEMRLGEVARGDCTGPENLPAGAARIGAPLVRRTRRPRPHRAGLPAAVAVREPAADRRFTWLRLLRVHQWAKNLLLFVPLVCAHQLGQGRLLLASFIAFFSFSFGASGIYILNDLHDLPADRLHPRKRFRPLAAGTISIPAGLAASAVLIAAALGLGVLLPARFFAMLVLYFVISTSYTFVLKQKTMIDVICLAALYTHRILAGGAATGITLSPWLMTFSMFLFLSLAFAKRYTEIALVCAASGDDLPGRGYRAIDLDLIRSLGPASGYVAVLVICLFLNDPGTTALYHHPQRLCLLCPVLLYWISRIWFLAQRGELHSDPVVYALSDIRSIAAGLVAAAIVVAATV